MLIRVHDIYHSKKSGISWNAIIENLTEKKMKFCPMLYYRTLYLKCQKFPSYFLATCFRNSTVLAVYRSLKPRVRIHLYLPTPHQLWSCRPYPPSLFTFEVSKLLIAVCLRSLNLVLVPWLFLTIISEIFECDAAIWRLYKTVQPVLCWDFAAVKKCIP